MWGPTLDEMVKIWDAAKEAGHAFSLLNIGGGLPAFYEQDIEAPTDYAARVMAELGRGPRGASGVRLLPKSCWLRASHLAICAARSICQFVDSVAWLKPKLTLP